MAYPDTSPSSSHHMTATGGPAGQDWSCRGGRVAGPAARTTAGVHGWEQWPRPREHQMAVRQMLNVLRDVLPSR